MTLLTSRRLLGVPRKVWHMLQVAGDQVAFYGKTYGWTFRVLRRYRIEVVRLIAEVSLGTGALAMIGGTAVIIAFVTGFAGVEVGLQGYKQLSDVGMQAFAGFVSAYVNTREVAPLIAGVGLVATVGAGFTAQLGAMRISEEIDAMEVMAVPSIPFLVTTRVIAGFIAVIPLYSLALIMSYAASRLIVTGFNSQPSGAYDHYFATFLIPQDVITSFVKALVMAVVVMSVCCYYGFRASGGPAGVGFAVGRAVRLSLIAVMFVDLALSLALYGTADTLRISS